MNINLILVFEKINLIWILLVYFICIVGYNFNCDIILFSIGYLLIFNLEFRYD